MSDRSERAVRALDGLSIGFQVIGFDWRYIYVNPAAAAHGRRTPAELEGRLITDMYPGIEGTHVFSLMRACMTERTAHLVENLFMFPDGEARWFDVRIEPIDEGLCVYSVDIHERKAREIEAQRHYLETQGDLVKRRRFWRAWRG